MSKGKRSRYSMLIEWSDADDAYIVSFPEWDKQESVIAHIHGRSYKQAARRGKELLDYLLESMPEEERPTPATYDIHAYNETDADLASRTEQLMRDIEGGEQGHKA